MKASTKASQKLLGLTNGQVANEFGSMIQYFTIASRFDEDRLPELNSHFFKLAERKKENALRFMDYVTGHEADLSISPPPPPRTQFQSTEEAVKFSLEKETQAAEQFKMIARVAKEESEHATEEFVEELLVEQIEEVTLVKELLEAVERAGESNLLLVEDFLIKKTSVAVEL